MKWVVTLLLLVSAHFALTALIPGPKALVYWPFAQTTRPTVEILAGSSRTVTQMLAVVAGGAYILATLALFHLFVPQAWFNALVMIGAAGTILLYLLYAGVFSILPIALALLLVVGVTTLGWTAPMLNGG